MAFKATLTVNGKDYQIMSYSCGLSQMTSQDGLPSSDVKGGLFQLSILSSEDTGLLEWMTDPTKVQDGEINFYKSENSEQVMKKLKFTKGYCVNHHESFSNGNMIENIVVSPQKIQIGNAEHEKTWPK